MGFLLSSREAPDQGSDGRSPGGCGGLDEGAATRMGLARLDVPGPGARSGDWWPRALPCPAAAGGTEPSTLQGERGSRCLFPCASGRRLLQSGAVTLPWSRATLLPPGVGGQGGQDRMPHLAPDSGLVWGLQPVRETVPAWGKGYEACWVPDWLSVTLLRGGGPTSGVHSPAGVQMPALQRGLVRGWTLGLGPAHMLGNRD